MGLQKYGVFVRAEDFGSEFFMGRLMKKVPESRICFLEGKLLKTANYFIACFVLRVFVWGFCLSVCLCVCLM